MRFGRTPSEIEHNRKVFLVALFAIAGSVFLVPLGFFSVFDGRVSLGAFLLLNSFFCLTLMVYSRRSGRVAGVSHAFAVQAAALALFLIFHGGIDGSGVYYGFGLALMMVMASYQNMRMGILVCVAFLALVAIGLYGPFSWTYDYSSVHKSRILLGYAALFIMALISEHIRTRSYSAITDTTEQLSADAFHDSLTGLLNRRGLETRLDTLEADDFPAVVTVIDLDRFKDTNDNHGHEAGDEALRYIASQLRMHMKGRDLLSRWGGEEFLIVFTQTDLEDAFRVLEQLRVLVAADTIRHPQGQLSISFSAGMAAISQRDHFAEAVQRADTYLYKAKELGRNRVETDLDTVTSDRP